MTTMTVKRTRPEKSIHVRLARERTTENTAVYREVIPEGGTPALFTKPLYIPKERLQQQFGGELPGQLDLLVTAIEGVIRPAVLPDVLVLERQTANFGAYAAAVRGQFFWGKAYLPKASLLPLGEVPYRLLLTLSLPGGK
jgi:hypothetical protein